MVGQSNNEYRFTLYSLQCRPVLRVGVITTSRLAGRPSHERLKVGWRNRGVCDHAKVIRTPFLERHCAIWGIDDPQHLSGFATKRPLNRNSKRNTIYGE
jgi:hypothetical protein